MPGTHADRRGDQRRARTRCNSEVRMPVDQPDEDVPAQPGLEPEPVLAGDPAGVAQRHAVAGPARPGTAPAGRCRRASSISGAASASSTKKTSTHAADHGRYGRAAAGARRAGPASGRRAPVPAPASPPAFDLGQRRALDRGQAHLATSSAVAADRPAVARGSHPPRAVTGRPADRWSARPARPVSGKWQAVAWPPPSRRHQRRLLGRRRCPAPSSSGCGTGSPTAGPAASARRRSSRIRPGRRRAAVTSGIAESSARVYGCCGRS